MDILYDSNTETPLIKDGDFVVGESAEYQHVRHILVANLGDFRESPLTGVNMRSEFNGSSDVDQVKQRIKLQLELDGYQVETIEIPSFDDVDIDVTRIR